MIKFNEQQMEIINHGEGSIMVIAGAGSGKSTTLVHRIKKLIDDGVSQDDIVTITFTKNSANDLKKKLNKLNIFDVRVGTFHSVLSKMLSENGVNVFKTIPQFEIKKAFNEVRFNSNIEDILSFISFQKTYGRFYNDEFVVKDSEYTEEELRKFYRIYEDLKKNNNAYDFDDWMIEALKILSIKPNAFKCKYLLVDEHQDNNLIQNQLIKLMCPSGNIMVIGDAKQSIYGFRGANPTCFMNFQDDYPNTKVVYLDNNYRSCGNIVEKANDFMRNYKHGYRHYSDSIPTIQDDAEINFIKYDSKEDQCEEIANKIQNMILFDGVSPKDIAILYRLNDMSVEMEMALTKRNIDFYVENDSNFFKSRQISPIIAMLRLVEDKDNDEAFLDILKSRCYPFTYIPKKVAQDIEKYAFNHNCSYLDASTKMKLQSKHKQSFDNFRSMLLSITELYHNSEDLFKVVNKIIFALKINDFIESNWTGEEMQSRKESISTLVKFVNHPNIESFMKFISLNGMKRKKKDENAIQLMTIHRSKGLEWDNVFLIGLQEDKFPSSKSDEEEEARLFYVAITRAKSFLHVCQINDKNSFGDKFSKSLACNI